MGKNSSTSVDNVQDFDPVQIDADFASWMIAHEESVRKAWQYDEIWADESISLRPTVFIVKKGAIIEAFHMEGFFGKWDKSKTNEEAAYVGFPVESIQELYSSVRFIARRATNSITKEVLYYEK